MAKRSKSNADWSALDGFKPSAPANNRNPPQRERPAGDAPDGLLAEMLGGRRDGARSAAGRVKRAAVADAAAGAAAECDRAAGMLAEVSEELDRQAALAAAAEERAAVAEEERGRAEAAAAEADALAGSLAKERDAARERAGALEKENAALKAELDGLREKAALAGGGPSLRFRAEFLERELAEARRLPSRTLLRAPGSGVVKEIFAGEIFEHVAEALAGALSDASASGRDRRAEILEAVLAANPVQGRLAGLREKTAAIVKGAGRFVGAEELAALEKLGFKAVSGAKHNKIRWGRVQVAVSKTPSDNAHGAQNCVRDICNAAF